MGKRLSMPLWLVLALVSGCATPDVPPAPPSVLRIEAPRLGPPPPDVMVQREPNFLERLQSFFQQKPANSSSGSPVRPTTLSGN